MFRTRSFSVTGHRGHKAIDHVLQLCAVGEDSEIALHGSAKLGREVDDTCFTVVTKEITSGASQGVCHVTIVGDGT